MHHNIIQLYLTLQQLYEYIVPCDDPYYSFGTKNRRNITFCSSNNIKLEGISSRVITPTTTTTSRNSWSSHTTKE